MAQVGGEIADELGDVAPRGGQLLHREQRGLRVVVGQRVRGLEHQLGVGDAEDLEHIVELDLAAAVSDQLLEGPEGIAEAARGRAGDHGPGRGRQLDLLGRGDPLEHPGDLV